MLRICFTCCLLGLLGAAVAGWERLASLEHDAGPPRVRVQQHVLDLGRAAQGTTVRARFSVSNAGGRRLVITERGELCCGDSGTATAVIVPPGATRVLPIDVEIGTWRGPMTHRKSYLTNDPAQPQFVLTLRLQAVPALPATGQSPSRRLNRPPAGPRRAQPGPGSAAMPAASRTAHE